jgi:hypothetical protein
MAAQNTRAKTPAPRFPQENAPSQTLAFGNYLMFDHTMRCRAADENYGDYCDV